MGEKKILSAVSRFFSRNISLPYFLAFTIIVHFRSEHYFQRQSAILGIMDDNSTMLVNLVMEDFIRGHSTNRTLWNKKQTRPSSDKS